GRAGVVADGGTVGLRPGAGGRRGGPVDEDGETAAGRAVVGRTAGIVVGRVEADQRVEGRAQDGRVVVEQPADRGGDDQPLVGVVPGGRRRERPGQVRQPGPP